jgi:hypothetical protein
MDTAEGEEAYTEGHTVIGIQIIFAAGTHGLYMLSLHVMAELCPE